MKTFNKVWLLLFSFLLLSNCTRDDICSPETQTTPKLRIKFEDNLLANVAKEVKNLKVIKKESEQIVWMGTAQEITIPLNTETNETSYIFSYEEGEDVIFSDEIIFTYDREEVYISRACGFKMHFNAIENKLLNNPNPQEAWIDYITILNENIEDENTAHIVILH